MPICCVKTLGLDTLDHAGLWGQDCQAYVANIIHTGNHYSRLFFHFCPISKTYHNHDNNEFKIIQEINLLLGRSFQFLTGLALGRQ